MSQPQLVRTARCFFETFRQRWVTVTTTGNFFHRNYVPHGRGSSCDVCRCYVDSQEIVDQANKYKENLEKSLKNMENNHKLLRRIISEKIQKEDMIKFMSPIMLLSSIGIDYHDLTEDEKKIVHEELRKIGVDWKDC